LERVFPDGEVLLVEYVEHAVKHEENM
jgi:hypothetical protein